jgi:transposase
MVSDLHSIIRVAQARQDQPSAVMMNGRRCNRVARVAHTRATTARKRKRGSKVHMAVDALGHLLVVHVMPTGEQERAQVHKLCEAVQGATGHSVKLAWADQGYTGEAAPKAAQYNGIDLQIVKLPEAKKGFVLLPRRWVVERSFGWLASFHKFSRDYERLPEVLGGLHFLAFAVLMSPTAARVMVAVGIS